MEASEAYVPWSSHGAKARKNRHARDNLPVGIIDAIPGLMNQAVKQISSLPTALIAHGCLSAGEPVDHGIYCGPQVLLQFRFSRAGLSGQ